MATAVLQTSHVSSSFGKCTEEPIEWSQRISTQVKVECAGKVGGTPQLDYRLLPLASQHHASEYNRLKFGPAGSSMTYVPISLVLPEQVKALQERQARLAKQKAWWHAEKRIKHTPISLPADKPAGERATTCDSSADLRDELFAAMTETMLPPTLGPAAQQTTIKTSDTHPINVSVIIPFELLRIISAHLVERGESSPTMFELPPVHHLHRTVLLPPSDARVVHAAPTTLSTSYHATALPPRPPSSNSLKSPKLTQFLWSTPSIRRAFHSAVGTPSWSEQGKRARPRSLIASGNGLRGGHGPAKPQPIFTLPALASTAAEVKIEKQMADILRPQSASLPSGQEQVPSLRRSRTDFAFLRPFIPTRPFSVTGARYPYPEDVMNTSARPATPVPDVPVPPSEPKMIGNLFLSSCPGKKVRLDRPAKGRGSVCRDLRQDLLRMKDLGVSCIVCCLDDEELDFLGVSWIEYAQLADELSIDMLRLPTPEGLAPLDPAAIDTHLKHLIKTYTLHGLPILIHCRGGVGRAGLLACCWLLKLGLCGWLEPLAEEAKNAGSFDDIYRALAPGRVPVPATCPDTLALVERVIAVVRRRRSAKAVETYEQVKFLVDFVEYLRAAGDASACAHGHVEAAPECDMQVD